MVGRGEVLGGRYRLIEKIGEGGMGTVWLADDASLGREVAVKVLHKTLVGDASASERFRNEARAAAQIDHPGICGVVDVGEHEGAPFMVMERLQGESLADRLTRERVLAPRVAVGILLEVLDALDAAHTAGILHRDLKPENIYLARDGERVVAKILDFGVSKFIGGDAERVKLTRTGALVGTPAYMSPEQALGLDDVDVRSDVWAAGVLAYEMLAGRLPCEGPNYNAVLVKIATEAPRPLQDVAAGVDPALAQVVMRMLAHRRDDRLPSARAASQALQAWLGGAPTALPAARVAMPTPRAGTTPMSWAEASAPTLVSPHTPSPVGPAAAGASPNRWLMPAVLALVVGGGAMLVYRGLHAPPREARGAARPVTVAAVEPAPSAQPVGYQLELLGLPPGAQVMVNGTVVQPPTRVRGGQSARIEVSAPGFEPWRQTVTPTGDVALTYEGRRLPPTPAVATTPEAAPPQAPARPSRASASRNRARGARRAARATERPLPTGLATDPD